ncbi:DUF1236 domain-containing protein [Bradyrhizobium sp. SZCCHNRI1009]|uniref:DUF1236 domain-containing protein n=1 Tax=Bradyrhizobium sp. SZCCHNRI1009 TaxID=3057277 RepID=UPI002915CADE|nr:DUF1236 domain-containing protein [Bradyrhizobium sp. SZCCHNRI1009]
MKREGGAAAPTAREAIRPGSEAKSVGAAVEHGASEAKQSAQGRSEPSSAAREQAQERPAHDAKQSAEQSKGERGPASAQRERDAKESAETKSQADSKQADKQSDSKSKAESKQQQGRADEPRKGEDRAAETKSGATDRKSDREAERSGSDKSRQSQDERKAGTSDQAADKQTGRSKQANQPGATDSKSTTAQQNQQTGPAGAAAGKPDATGQASNQTQTNNTRSSTQVSVNEQQKTRVVDQLKRDHDFDRARTDIDIRINVGERLPERVRPRPLPSDIVTIVPEYRGYEYTVVHDEIAIVDPRSREIVDVIPQDGMRADRGYERGGYGVSSTRIVLSDDQRQILRRAATETGTVGSTTSSSTSSGTSCLSLRRVPDELARSNPELANYQYLAIGEQVVLVDPRDQKVVQVIDQQQ